MRFMIKATIPAEAGNKVIKSGRLPETMQAILESIKPEAVYFTLENGQRTSYAVVNVAEASQLPKFAEPFWLAFNGTVEAFPVMSQEELAKAGPDIVNAAKKFGSVLN